MWLDIDETKYNDQNRPFVCEDLQQYHKKIVSKQMTDLEAIETKQNKIDPTEPMLLE